jgi:hypothetical protein
MVTPRVGNGVGGFNTRLLPSQRQNGLHGSNGRFMCLVVVGTGLAPLIVGKACPPPSWHALLARYWWAFGHSYMVPQFASVEKLPDFLLRRIDAATS